VVPVGVHAGGVAAALLLLGGFGWSQSGDFSIAPDDGPAGTTITVTDTVAGTCGTYTVTFDGAQQTQVATDGGQIAVSFDAPDVEPGEYVVEGFCDDPEAGGGHREFHIEGLDTTTTTTTEVPTTDDPGETTTTEGDGGVPTTTTTEVDVPIPHDIETCEAQAQQAQAELRYEAQRSMVVGRTYDVTAVLSLGGDDPDVTFEGTTTVVTIDGVRCTITAKLTGPDFDVAPKTVETQSFVDALSLVWVWDVRPRHDGNDLELVLAFQATVVQGDLSVPGPVTLHEATIDVDAEEQSLGGQIWDAFSGFLHDPIVASVIAGILGAAILTLGPKTYRNVRARYARRPSTGPAVSDSVPRPPPPE